jgi:hypothetical protein
VIQGDRKIRDLPHRHCSAAKITIVSSIFRTPPLPGRHFLVLAGRAAHSQSEWRRPCEGGEVFYREVNREDTELSKETKSTSIL